MILLNDVLCDSPMGDAVVHVTAFDGSKDGRIRRILDVRTVEIIGGHQDGVFHDGDTLARKLAHMIDRLLPKTCMVSALVGMVLMTPGMFE